MSEQMWIRGENGTLHVFSVPLHPGIASRLAKGDLVRVNEDGSLWTGADPDDTEPDDGDGESGDDSGSADDAPADAPPLPPKSASRAVWTKFAIEQGMDRDRAATMTKAQLVTEFTRPRTAP